MRVKLDHPVPRVLRALGNSLQWPVVATVILRGLNPFPASWTWVTPRMGSCSCDPGLSYKTFIHSVNESNQGYGTTVEV